MKAKMCMLEENKKCDNCCECNTCDLDSAKACDNCAKCLGLAEDYRSYTLKELVSSGISYKKARLQRAKIMLKLSFRNIERYSKSSMN